MRLAPFSHPAILPILPIRATCARASRMATLQKLLKHTDLLVGLGILVIVGMLIVPLPQWALDTALVIAIAMSVIILLTAVNISDPLQFSSFPSLLLVTTL